MGKNITIVGGGSSSFVPLLLRRLILSESLGDSNVTLMDVDEGRSGLRDRRHRGRRDGCVGQ